MQCPFWSYSKVNFQKLIKFHHLFPFPLGIAPLQYRCPPQAKPSAPFHSKDTQRLLEDVPMPIFSDPVSSSKHTCSISTIHWSVISLIPLSNHLVVFMALYAVHLSKRPHSIQDLLELLSSRNLGHSYRPVWELFTQLVFVQPCSQQKKKRTRFHF